MGNKLSCHLSLNILQSRIAVFNWLDKTVVHIISCQLGLNILQSRIAVFNWLGKVVVALVGRAVQKLKKIMNLY